MPKVGHIVRHWKYGTCEIVDISNEHPDMAGRLVYLCRPLLSGEIERDLGVDRFWCVSEDTEPCN